MSNSPAPEPFTVRQAIARRAADELRDGAVLNYGFGIPDGVAKLVAARGQLDRYYQTIEHGTYGGELLEAPLDQWPAVYPSVAQSKFLLRHGVFEPLLTTLTRVGTIEGFGGLIREWGCGDVQQFVVEPIADTALGHLQSGLFEAHARDETGFGGLAGHRDMWFAARDLAYGQALDADTAAGLLARSAAYGVGQAVAVEEARAPEIAPALESMLRRMIGLMFIEVSAFHTFAWAEELLADTDLVAGDGAAATVVSYIRSDETPHVEYLRTALGELRTRTIRTVDGGTIAGGVVVDRLYSMALADSLGDRRAQQLAAAEADVVTALDGRADAADLLAEFRSLAA